jgi:hypothetical protein
VRRLNGVPWRNTPVLLKAGRANHVPGLMVQLPPAPKRGSLGLRRFRKR